MLIETMQVGQGIYTGMMLVMFVDNVDSGLR